MLSHLAICNHMLWMQRDLPLTEEDRVLQKTPFSFDASVWEFYAPLLVGATLVLARPAGHQDSVYLSQVMTEQQITILQLVPSLLQLLLEEKEFRACRSLRRVFCGGEALTLALQERFFEHFACELYNLYGPTEATIDAIFWACQRDSHRRSVPVGRPVANIQAYILDARFQPEPINVPGELYLAGAGLARGYLRRAELTAERFVPNPFSTEPGSRLYRTGDRVRSLPGGEIEFLGRFDRQMKLRGYRIELGEIEALLAQYPGVKEGIVVMREDRPGNARLVGYLVMEREAIRGVGQIGEQLRRALGEQLPEYMIPVSWVVLDTLPLTPNGKVDRRALPPPTKEQDNRSDDLELPQTPLQEILCGIWQETLQISTIHLSDDFFAAGGHSLLATRLISRIRTTFHIELPVVSVFKAPVLREQAYLIEQALSTGQESETPPLVPAPRAVDPPLSFAQQRLWFLDQLEAGSSAYLVPQVYRLGGPLVLRTLESSLEELVRRQESLRTTFQMRGDQPVQVIHATWRFRLPLVDLRVLRPDEQEREGQRLARQEAHLPCDLTRGPLWRACLLRLSAQKHIFLVTMHHIITDGWSERIFQRELAQLYQAFVAGQPSPLAPLLIQYADFAIWQRQWLQGAVLQSHLAYWRKQLAGVPELLLPADRPRPARRTPAGALSSFSLSPELSNALLVFSRQEGATLFMTLLAGFQLLFYRYTGQTDIVVGADIANRNRTEIEGIIGFFINLLVLRTTFHGKPSFRTLLHRVREMVLYAYAHQDVPFDLLTEKLVPAHVLGRMPLVQVLFVLQNIFSPGEQGQGATRSAAQERPNLIWPYLCKRMLAAYTEGLPIASISLKPVRSKQCLLVLPFCYRTQSVTLMLPLMTWPSWLRPSEFNRKS